MIMKFSLLGTVRPKKNSKRICTTKSGRTLLLSSKLYLQWYKDALSQLRFMKLANPMLTKNVMVEIRFYFSDKRRRDLTNLAESVMDLIVDYGVISDDNWKVVNCLILKGFESENGQDYVTIEVMNEAM